MHRRIAMALVAAVTTVGLVPLLGGCFAAPHTAAPADNSANTDNDNASSQGQPRVRASDAKRKYPLDTLPRAEVTIAGHTFQVWVAHAADPARPNVLQEGLMYVPSEEIGDDEGMLFVFTDERVRGFWMLNTIAPLDIAYARMNGQIVTIAHMPPQTLQTFSSIEPAMFALEVKQGTFARLGIQEGQTLQVPLKAVQVPGS